MAISQTQQQRVNVGNTQISEHDFHLKPWKYIGYKEFSRYFSTDDDFFVLRRFDRLHSRILLRLQDQLVALEGELDLIDAELSRKEAQDVDNGCFRRDQDKRKDVLDQIVTNMELYDRLLVNYLSLKARDVAPKIIAKNIKQWLDNHAGPIDPEEVTFLEASDLITASKATKSALRRVFEQRVLAPTMGLFGLLARKPPPDGLPGDSETTVVGNDEHVDTISVIAVFFSATVMLVVPLWTLVVGVNNIHLKLGIITLFLLLFLGVLTWGTQSRTFEILAATAGYCAVLVVFLQIGTDPSSVTSATSLPNTTTP